LFTPDFSGVKFVDFKKSFWAVSKKDLTGRAGRGPLEIVRVRIIRVRTIVNNFLKISLDFWALLWYIITMTAEQVREEQRKTENRVQRWNERLQKVRKLQREWQKENEEKFGPFLKKF